METQYFKDYSDALGRDMEVKVYGHAGRPVLFIPCQNGRFFDFENFHMDDVWAPYIESGKCMVFAIDTLDEETWSNKEGDPAWRIERHEQWMRYITDEMVPFMRAMANERNGWEGEPGVVAFGCSLGATHAANLFLRRPDLFDGLLALSGIYDARYGFDEYMDEKVYNNSPVDFLENMGPDHPWVSRYNSGKAIIVVGQGPWEIPDTTFQLLDVCSRKGINIWFDIWGYDVRHDWDWWYQQVEYHLPHIFD